MPLSSTAQSPSPEFSDVDTVTLSDDEMMVALWVVKMRDKINNKIRNVVDQSNGRNCREHLAMAAELAAARLFNVYPDIQWHDYYGPDLWINGTPVDVKLATDYGINIRWNEKKSKCDPRTVFLGMYHIAGNSFGFCGGVRKPDLMLRTRRTGNDNVPYFSVPHPDLTWRPYV